MLDKVPDDSPAYLNYKVHADKNSLYNTPPVFSIYAMSLTLEWLQQQGGIEGIQERNEEKAKLIYDVIDGSEGFYRCPVDEHARSIMNVVFRLPTEEMEAAFIGEAKRKGMIGLKGHRSVGGCRASLYNAMPREGAAALADFMKEFRKKYS
jgi:phosphoserine aminotransferase